MNSLRLVGVLSLGLIILGFVASDFGFAGPTVATPVINAPEDVGFFDGILLPFKFAWSLVTSLFQLMTFQMDGIPPVIAAIIGGTIDMMVGFVIIKIIRG